MVHVESLPGHQEVAIQFNHLYLPAIVAVQVQKCQLDNFYFKRIEGLCRLHVYRIILRQREPDLNSKYHKEEERMN